jgi:hypothetical protein
MHESRQLHLRLHTQSAATLSAENEREVIEALAELILAVAKGNANTNDGEKGGPSERKGQ